MAIDFPPAMAEFMEIWLGASVARGNEDLGFDSRLPYQDLAGDVREYRAQAQRVLSWAKNSLPPAIGDQFALALGQFVSDGGVDRLTELAQEAEKAAEQQVEYSRRLAEAKYELIWEFVLMKIELAAIAVEVAFSGGAAAAQIPLVEARTALRMMLIVQRLSRRVPLVSTTVTEAVEEALTSLGAQLTSMIAPDDPERKRKSLDGKEIGVSAFFGAVAGAVGGALGQAVQGALKDVLKDKPQWFKEALQVPEAFVNEGAAEAVAEWFVKGVVYGKWDEFKPGTFVQAGISGVLFEAAADATIKVTDFLTHKFNQGAVGAQHSNDAADFLKKFSAGSAVGGEKPSTVSTSSGALVPGVGVIGGGPAATTAAATVSGSASDTTVSGPVSETTAVSDTSAVSGPVSEAVSGPVGAEAGGVGGAVGAADVSGVLPAVQRPPTASTVPAAVQSTDTSGGFPTGTPHTDAASPTPSPSSSSSSSSSSSFVGGSGVSPSTSHSSPAAAGDAASRDGAADSDSVSLFSEVSDLDFFDDNVSVFSEVSAFTDPGDIGEVGGAGSVDTAVGVNGAGLAPSASSAFSGFGHSPAADGFDDSASISSRASDSDGWSTDSDDTAITEPDAPGEAGAGVRTSSADLVDGGLPFASSAPATTSSLPSTPAQASIQSPGQSQAQLSGQSQSPGQVPADGTGQETGNPAALAPPVPLAPGQSAPETTAPVAGQDLPGQDVSGQDVSGQDVSGSGSVGGLPVQSDTRVQTTGITGQMSGGVSPAVGATPALSGDPAQDPTGQTPGQAPLSPEAGQPGQSVEPGHSVESGPVSTTSTNPAVAPVAGVPVTGAAPPTTTTPTPAPAPVSVVGPRQSDQAAAGAFHTPAPASASAGVQPAVAKAVQAVVTSSPYSVHVQPVDKVPTTTDVPGPAQTPTSTQAAQTSTSAPASASAPAVPAAWPGAGPTSRQAAAFTASGAGAARQPRWAPATSATPARERRTRKDWGHPPAVFHPVKDSSTGKLIGEVSFNAADLAPRMEKYGKLSEQKQFVQWHLDEQGKKVGAWRDLPPGTGGSFFLGMHYDDEGFRVEGADGRTHLFSAGELGELLRDNPALQDFTDITLIACESGRDIPTGEHGTSTNPAQIIADLTGKTVHAPTGSFIVHSDVVTGAPAIHLHHGEDGKATEMHTFRPSSAGPQGTPPVLIEYDEQGEAREVSWKEIEASPWYRELHPAHRERLRSAEDYTPVDVAVEGTRNTVVAAVDGGAAIEDVALLSDLYRLRDHVSVYAPETRSFLSADLQRFLDPDSPVLPRSSVTDFGHHVPYTDMVVPHPGPWAKDRGPSGLAHSLNHVLGHHSSAHILLANEGAIEEHSQSAGLMAEIEEINARHHDVPGYLPMRVEAVSPPTRSRWDGRGRGHDFVVLGGVELRVRHQPPYRVVTVTRGHDVPGPGTTPAPPATADTTEQVPAFPGPDAAWNASAAEAELPLPPRFPEYYAEVSWEQRGQYYERKVGELLANHPAVLNEARKMLRKAYKPLKDAYGLDRASRAFVPDPTVDARARVKYLLDSAAGATLHELMEAFADAAWRNTGADTLGKLWAQQPGLNPHGVPLAPATGRPYSAALVADYRSRGLVVSEGPADEAEWLLRIHRALDVRGASSLWFREVLMAWLLPHPVQRRSLVEVYAAAQRAGVRDAAEPQDITMLDGARLYGLADALIEPRRWLRQVTTARPNWSRVTLSDLALPHQLTYAERAQWMTPEVTGDGRPMASAALLARLTASGRYDYLTLPSGEHTKPEASAETTWEERRRAVRSWYLRHPYPGLLGSNVPAELLPALYLSGVDYRLLQQVPVEGTVGAEELRQAVRGVVEDAFADAGDSWFSLPLLLLRDEGLRELAGQVRAVPYDGPDRAARLAGLRGELVDRAPALVEGLAGQLREHREMAIEAVSRLPMELATAWWVTYEQTLPAPVLGQEVTVQPLHQVSTDRERVLEEAGRASGSGGGRVVVWEVAESTGRDVTPFARDPRRARLVYPERAVFEVRSVTPVRSRREDGGTFEYLRVTLKELPQQLPRERWRMRMIMRELTYPGTPRIVGYSAHNTWEWAERFYQATAMKRGLYQLVDKDGRGKRTVVETVPFPWSRRPLLITTHSNGSTIDGGNLYGRRTYSPAEHGLHLRQALGTWHPDRKLSLFLAECRIAMKRRGVEPAVQTVLDRSGQARAYGSRVNIGMLDLGNGESAWTSVTSGPQDPPVRQMRLEEFQPQKLSEAEAEAAVRSAVRDLPGHDAGFLELYSSSQWESVALRFEDALGRALAANPELVAAARRLLKNYHTYVLDGVGGDERAAAERFFPSAGAGAQTWVARLLDPDSGATPAELMRALYTAALNGRNLSSADASPVSVRALRRLGIPIRHVSVPAVRTVLDAYRRIGVVPEAELRELTAALLGWLLPGNRHRLYDVFAQAIGSGVPGTSGERAFFLAEGAQLYRWALESLPVGEVPEHLRAGLRLPQHQLYLSFPSWLTAQAGGVEAVPHGIWTDLHQGYEQRRRHEQALPTAFAASAGDPRQRALAGWTARHEGRSPLEGLTPAHVLALHLLGGADGQLPVETHKGNPGHLNMAAEALEALPPVGGPVWLVLRQPGTAWSVEPGAVTLPRFAEVHLSEQAALAAGVREGMLIEVERSTARDISLFAADPARGQARYPHGVDLGITRKGVRGGLEYFTAVETGSTPPARRHLPFTDLPAAPAAPDTGWYDEALLHEAKLNDQGAALLASVDTGEWQGRLGEDLLDALSTRSYQQWFVDVRTGRWESRERALPEGHGRPLFFVTRGVEGGFELALPGGRTRTDGGGYLARLAKNAVRDGHTHLVVLTLPSKGSSAMAASEFVSRTPAAAHAFGLPVYEHTGPISLLPAMDSGPTRLHLLPDSDGGPTGFVRTDPPPKRSGYPGAEHWPAPQNTERKPVPEHPGPSTEWNSPVREETSADQGVDSALSALHEIARTGGQPQRALPESTGTGLLPAPGDPAPDEPWAVVLPPGFTDADAPLLRAFVTERTDGEPGLLTRAVEAAVRRGLEVPSLGFPALLTGDPHFTGLVQEARTLADGLGEADREAWLHEVREALLQRAAELYGQVRDHLTHVLPEETATDTDLRDEHDGQEGHDGRPGQDGEPGAEPETEQVRPGTEPEAPWYVDEGALGHAFVRYARMPQPDQSAAGGPSTERTATDWAHAVIDGLRVHSAPRANGRDPDAAVYPALRAALRDLLLTDDPKAWSDLLAKGRMLEADGHVVWLRPQVRNLRPQPKKPAGAVRDYSVGFAATSTGGEKSRDITHGMESALLNAISISSRAASTVLLGLPNITASVSRKHVRKWKRDVVSGRKLFIVDTNDFDADLEVRVFVDGVERPHGVISPLEMAIGLPSAYTAPGAPRPDRGVPQPAPLPGEQSEGDGAFQRPTRAKITLNAMDTTAAVADLQAALLEAGIRAATVVRIVAQAQETLNERSVLNRSRWLLTSGDITNPIHVATVTARSFDGHFHIRARIESVQYVGMTEGVGVRDDIGGGLSAETKRDGGSKTSLGFQLSLLGGGGDSAARGIFPAFGVKGTGERSDGHSLNTTGQQHTVLNTRSDQARYRTRLRLTVTPQSVSHTVRPVETTVTGETAMPLLEAPGFEERLLGSVVTPAVRALFHGPRLPQEPPPGPVDAQPWVRALLRESGTAPAFDPTRPARLDTPLPAPHSREPLALATRRGQGFGMLSELPGSELVLEQLRSGIRADLEKRRGKKAASADWSQADRELLMFFGTPALESDLSALLTGIAHTFTVGGRTYRAGVRGHLRERLEDVYASYPRTVNARSVTSRKTAGHLKRKGGAEAGVGGGVRLGINNWARFQLGLFRLLGTRGKDSNQELISSSKAYRRTETTQGVDEHGYNMVYELFLQPDPEDDGPTTTWWIDRPDDVTAIVDVPHEHVPTAPLKPEQLTAAGQWHISNSPPRPDVPRVNLAEGGTSGIYPAFLDMPRLPELASSLHALLNGLKPDEARAWAADWRNWPDAIREAARTTELGGAIDAMAGPAGHVVTLPDRDGYKQAIRLHLEALNPEDLGRTPEGDTEIEHYLQAAEHHQDGRDTFLKAASANSLGPQFFLGSEAESDHGEEADSEASTPHTGGSGAGGRLTLALLFGTQRTWTKERKNKRGHVTITRATYGGATHTVRATPVLKVTALRWKGDTMQEVTRYLSVRDALDLLIPERRMRDLLPGTGTGTGTASGAGQQEEPRTVAHPAMLPGIAHPELLTADAVLPAILDKLRERGLLRDKGGDRPNLLQRLLTDSYSSQRLEILYPALTTSGVRRWVPVPGPLGTTRYLWINVTGTPRPATDDRPRPDVTLTLRSQGIREEETGTSVSDRRHAGFLFTARGGADHKHAGAEFGAGYESSSGRGQGEAHETKDIYRTSTKDTAHEFNHPMTFRIEMGTSTKPPTLVELPVRGAKWALLSAGRGLGTDTPHRWWETHEPWVWYEDSAADGSPPLTGTVRLLVPQHLTLPLGAEGIDADLAPSHGTDPRWTRAAASDGQRPTAPVPGVPQQMIDNLHPWAVPAATAVQRWAASAARRYAKGKAPDLTDGRPPHVYGLGRHTLAGRLFEHYTSEGMLRPNIADLLTGSYRIPVGDDTVMAGLELTAAHPLLPGTGARFKARRYQQKDHAPTSSSEKASGWSLAFGPEGGGDTHGSQETERAPLELLAVEDGEKHDQKASETDESNKESTRNYRHYRFDARLVLHGPGGTVRLDVDRALYGMLPLEADGQTLADGLEELLPLLRGTATAAAAGTPTTTTTGPLPAIEETEEGTEETAAVAVESTGDGAAPTQRDEDSGASDVPPRPNDGTPAYPAAELWNASSAQSPQGADLPSNPREHLGSTRRDDGDPLPQDTEPDPVALDPVELGPAEVDPVELGLVELDSEAERPVEALLEALRRGAPDLLTGEEARRLGIDSTGPHTAAADALYDWAGREVTDDDLPAGTRLLAPGHQATVADLKAAGVTVPSAKEAEATLLGTPLATGDLGLTPLQEFRLLMRQDPAQEAVAPVMADLLGRRLGFRVELTGPGGPGDVRRLGAETGPAVLLVHRDGRYLAGVAGSSAPSRRLEPHGVLETGDQQVRGPWPATRGPVQRWEIRSEAGRYLGEAVFSAEDWATRAPLYARLEEIDTLVRWRHGPDGAPNAVRVPMSGPGRPTYYLAGHGHDAHRLMEDMAASLVAAGTTHLTVEACNPWAREPGGWQRLWARLQQYADTTGITVTQPTGVMAVAPGGVGDPALYTHLLEDTEGNPTDVLTVRPGEGFSLSSPASAATGPGEDPGSARLPAELWNPLSPEALVRRTGVGGVEELPNLVGDAERDEADDVLGQSDAGVRDRLDDRFGDPVLPKRIKDEERDQDGEVRLNPLWTPLDEVDPHLLTTGNRDAVWLYTVTEDGRVILGTEDLNGIVAPEQFDALLAGMREKDPDLTAESLRKTLNGLGHTSIAAGFVDDGGEAVGRTLPGRSRVSGEFRWSEELGSWVVNDKSGRYMSEAVRPDLDAAEAAGWLANVAALFSDRLGVAVRTDQVKTAAAAPVPAPDPGPAHPLPEVSLADAALALATGTDPDQRARDLLDLLRALYRTPADDLHTMAPFLVRADAYRAARPVGAVPSLAVRLSELIDSVALNSEAFAHHVRTWRGLGVTNDELYALYDEMMSLANALRVHPEVTADPIRALAARLPGLSTADRATTLALLPPGDRERLASDATLVDALRDGLAPAEFASVAAHLMTQIPDGVEQPVSAGERARVQIAWLLQDPDVAARLLKLGTRVVVVPRAEVLTSLDAFRSLRGTTTGDGRPWEEVRGVGLSTAAVNEENLLGERTTVRTVLSAYADGYSTTVHEFAHTVHQFGLDAADKQRITDTFRATTEAGEAGNWPDGPLYGYGDDGRRSAPNYSSRDELEFFAQLTNVYFMANGGNDDDTKQPRNNGGPEWVRTHQPDLYPLLRRLYGEGPRPAPRHPRSVEPARPRGVRPADVNPVEATDIENEALARARALWDVAEGNPGEGGDSYVAVRALWDGTIGAHTPQPHTPAPPPPPPPPPLAPTAWSGAASPPTDSAAQRNPQELWALVDATFGSQPLSRERRTELFNSLHLIESARAGHPRFGAALDLDGITRMLLHLAPDAPVDAAQHYYALNLVDSAHRWGRGGSLDAIAAYGLTRQGYPEQSVLSGGDGAPHGRNWTERPGVHLDTSVVADPRGIHPAPWGPAAYAVVAERNAGGVVLADGRPVSDEEFAELVLHDPERRPDVPVVVLIGEEDGRNEALAQMIADHTRTRVWFTYGALLLEAAPNGRQVVFLAAPTSGSDPTTAWAPADPGQAPDDPAATVTSANGTGSPATDIHTHPPATVDDRH